MRRAATRGFESDEAVGAKYDGPTDDGPIESAEPEATRWNDRDGFSLTAAVDEPIAVPVRTEYALSDRAREVLAKGDASKSGDGGLMARDGSGWRESLGVGGEEWLDLDEEPFDRRIMLPSGSQM